MAGQQAKGLQRLINALGYSGKGLKAAWAHEQAFRQELGLCLPLVPLGWWLGDSGVERALLIGALVLVVIVELINSAVEAVVDRFGGDIHELSGRAKDIASAAVLLSVVNVVVIWGLVIFG